MNILSLRSEQWRLLESEFLEDVTLSISDVSFAVAGMPKDEVLDYITDVLYLNAVSKQRETQAGSAAGFQALKFSETRLFSQESVQRIIARHLAAVQVAEDRGWFFSGQGMLEKAMGRLLLSDISPSQAGSICRFLFTSASTPFEDLDELLLSWLRRNEKTPVEVTARLLLNPKQATRFTQSEHVAFQRQVAEQHPDLAGLPLDMLVELLAQQPLPDAWFQDAWTATPAIQFPQSSLHSPVWEDLLVPTSKEMMV